MKKAQISAAGLLSRAVKLEQAGKKRDAAELYAMLLKRFPKHPKAKAGLYRTRAESQSRQLTKADQVKLQKLQTLLNSGKFQEVSTHGSPLIDAYPALAFVPNVVGIAQAQMGHHELAIPYFQTAVSREPEFAPAYVNMSTSLRLLGKTEPALKAALKGAQLQPGDAECLVNLGLAHFASDDTLAGRKAFNDALIANPKSVAAFDGLCEIAEAGSDLDGLVETLENARAALKKPVGVLAFWQGVLASRTKSPEEALEVFDAISEASLPPEKRAKLHERRGKMLDKLGQYDVAFKAFHRANTIAAGRSVTGDAPNSYMRTLEQKQEELDDWSAGPWPDVSLPKTQTDLAFLVGFPRSGTTLLDTLLRGHEAIDVIEEKPMVRDLTLAMGETDLAALSQLADAEIESLQAAYFASAQRYTDNVDAKLPPMLIDKLPLNMTSAPLLKRVFPSAKFILSLRHPCACVLSCYMQNFRSNPAMDNFLTLEGAAKLYDRSMRYWCAAVNAFQIDHVTVRYEDLISDLPATVSPVIRNLGLEMQGSMLDHQKTALSRSRVATPSREQITQPIYTSAKARWRHYEAHLAPVMDVLTPWIDHWGYTDAPQTN